MRTLSYGTAAVLCLLMGGCSLSPMAKHTTAFSKATATVITGSENAYRAAVDLRHKEQVAAAVYAYDKNPQWSPYTDIKPLLTPAQLEARVTVLDGLKAYSASLVELTNAKPSKDLNTAAEGVGTNLQALSATVATSLRTAIPGATAMSTEEANGVTTAVRALGEYLVARKVKGALPKVTGDMNPIVTQLCELLNSDIVVLRRQADVDYTSLIQDQDMFIRHAGTGLTAMEHRDEVGKLLDIAAEQKANDDLLAQLQKALHTLALTHQALAAAAQGNDPESVHQKIVELEAAGESLSSYYSSLPTKK